MVTYKGSLFEDEEVENKQQHSFYTKAKDGVAIQLICEVEEDHSGLCYWFDYTDKIVYSGKRVVE